MNDWKKERQQYSRNWKEKNVKYIKRLQQFFDVAIKKRCYMQNAKMR